MGSRWKNTRSVLTLKMQHTVAVVLRPQELVPLHYYSTFTIQHRNIHFDILSYTRKIVILYFSDCHWQIVKEKDKHANTLSVFMQQVNDSGFVVFCHNICTSINNCIILPSNKWQGKALWCMQGQLCVSHMDCVFHEFTSFRGMKICWVELFYRHLFSSTFPIFSPPLSCSPSWQFTCLINHLSLQGHFPIQASIQWNYTLNT